MTATQRRWVSLVAILLVWVLPMAQTTRPASAADLLLVVNQVLTDEFPQVAVYFTFTDAAGLPITDVSKDRVQVVHNGKPIPELTLQLAEADQDGLAVVVAIDTSGSMQGQPLDDARAAVRQFLEKMGPRDRGAIVTFGQTASVVQGLTGDREALSRALDGLQAKGDTTLYDGVFEAVSLVAKEPLGRRAVVVISDGEDTHSTLKLDDVIARARETSTPVSAIAIGQFQIEPLRRLTLTTGGTLGEAPSAERLAERTAQMADLLRKQYVLRYRAPDTRPPENEVEIAVSQNGQQARASHRFAAPPMPLAVSVPTLPAGATVSGQVQLQPTLENAERVDAVEYLLDDAPLGTVTEPPYRFTWNTAETPPGQHTLTIRARLGDRVAEQQVPLVVAATTVVPAPSPSPSASLSPVAGAGVAGTPTAGGTANPTLTSTPTSTPEPTGIAKLFEEDSSLAWLGIGLGLIVMLAAGGGIIFALSRRSTPPPAQFGPHGPPGQPGFPPPDRRRSLPGGTQAPTGTFEPVTREARAVEGATLHDTREAQTAMYSAVTGPPASARLTVRAPGSPEHAWPLTQDQIIGRSEGPGVIVVADPRVSRRHARISWEDGHFVYRDLGPMNPTRHHGRTLPNPYVLQPGDRLEVGKSELVYEP
ncbi:MAG: VWA domain-containing protein [Chloroflexi bacterium]|nr:VWA domain-containing protein [Chloroflexota bacterium]